MKPAPGKHVMKFEDFDKQDIRAEMADPEKSRVLDLLTALSHQTSFSVNGNHAAGFPK
jgi:hypothetical protein